MRSGYSGMRDVDLNVDAPGLTVTTTWSPNTLAQLADAGLADRPATTVSCDPRVSPAGHHERQQRGSVRLTPDQCAVLQGFPSGWAWTGTKKSQHRQIGNAFPPALAEAVARAILRALS